MFLQTNLKFLRSVKIRVTAEQIVRLLEPRSIIVFHFLTFLWHLVLNYHTFAGIFHILFYRWDLVSKNNGYGIQYITIWNQVIEQGYFNGALLQDILEFTPPHKYKKIKSYLKTILPFIFTAIVFPLSIIVTINFWAIYIPSPQSLDEDNVTELYFSRWVNHGMHTTILLLTLLEKFLLYRPYSSGIRPYVGLFCVLFMYTLTCVILYIVGGVWPYPMFTMMDTWEKMTFTGGNFALGFALLTMGKKMNHKIWGEKFKTVAVENEKKFS